ncbi:deoxycytidylate deaminase [Photobacterium carnosum]|uniref:deoxycytidylate deaminase n=1 Tax=Photobacterium carnosum TaxID=2023717 RepID=UPI001E360F97|nr:deoxycytidylate deaminase [Photobacterium carnosum]MCD9498995.1 deoxycytidylate deaminase [Photobacterium carnosum]
MQQKHKFLASALEKLHSKNEDFIIFGLTGRTGSGCTTAANYLSSEKKDIDHCFFTENNPTDNFQRKEKIIAKFYEKNWQPFIHLQVSSILTLMFLCHSCKDELHEFFNSNKFINNDEVDFLLSTKNHLDTKEQELDKNDFNFYITCLNQATKNIRTKLGEANFIKLYQLLGKNARSSGKVTDSTLIGGEFFTIALEIKKVIEQLHHAQKKLNKNTYITIDAIRNPLEASYFQERFASFYLLAISCDNDVRIKRLKDKGLSDETIEFIDENEYASLDIDDESSFTGQDIQGCLQKADIYIDSNEKKDNYNSKKLLVNQLIKFVCLAQKPGLITPSPEERCMQVAYTSKLNSGCISRQVGAVVTKNNFSIKAVGWNDTPYGQVPCKLRSYEDLYEGKDTDAYSSYELKTEVFRTKIRSKIELLRPLESKGYNHSYCFKSEYNLIKGGNNQVHTRSLHAEENAFLQVSKDGGSGVEGGYLFTTASPCELCAKKAYQLGMTKIFYIDPYPGISFEHILSSGTKERQPQMVLFNGAIGRAFHNLYTPIVPYKDELKALMQ